MKVRKLLAKNVRNARLNAGLTQDKFAEAVGMSLRMLQDIEGEKSWPSPEMVEKIAHALHIDEARLFRDPKLKPTPAESLEIIAKLVHKETNQPLINEINELLLTAPESRRQTILTVLRATISDGKRIGSKDLLHKKVE